MRRLLPTLVALLVLPAQAAEAVVGGRDASRPYPHMASLRLDGSFICGASLVAPDRVLTAAHCVAGGEAGKTPYEPARLSFVLGSTTSDGTGGETFKATAVSVHESYNPESSVAFDVAVVTLDRAAKQEPIAIADTPQRSLWAPGRPSRVIGWGNNASIPVLDVGVQTTDRLQEVDVPVVADDECDATVGIDVRTQVCAGERNGGKDSCQGDSGGPLMVGDAAGKLFLVGIVSTGFGCGVPTQYGVYTRAADSTLRPWIAARLPAVAAPAPAATPAPAAGTPAKKKAKKKVSCKTRKQKRTAACKRIAKRKAAAKRAAARKRAAAKKKAAPTRG